MNPTVIANYACHVGENPLWNPFEKVVYWLDIPRGMIFRYDPQTTTHAVFYQGEVTGGFTLQQDGALLLFGAKGAVNRLKDGVLTPVIEQIAGEELNRFNDVIADPNGRVFAGTMPFHPDSSSGKLYRIDTDGTATPVLDGVGISNGMGFSPDLKTFYHTDSPTRVITRYDYDADTGAISNPRPFVVRPADDEGVPDGLTVDSNGFVWSATWDGSQLLRYDPDGKLEREVRFPTKKISSLTFGGDALSDIYATSAGGDNTGENGELAGALFHLRVVGITGKPEFLSQVKV